MGVPDVLDGDLEYYPYRIGKSGLVFRGPKRKLTGRFVAVIGGSETYGKFVQDPYPAQLEAILGLPVVNLGCMHASVGVFAEDASVVDICRRAEATIIQIMGASNISNRHYTVHPRRNDRFLKAAPPLRDLYPTVDFAQFNFTRHLLTRLFEASPEAFETLAGDIRSAWMEAMELLIDRVGGRILLLWMSERPPEGAADIRSGLDPLLVERPMLDALRDDVAGIVEVVASDAARAEGVAGKVFNQLEAQAAAEVPGPQFHLEAALALADALTPYFDSDAGDGAHRGAPHDLGPGLRASRSAQARR